MFKFRIISIVMFKIFNLINKKYFFLYSQFLSKRFRFCGASVHFEKIYLLVGGKYISIGKNSSIQRGCYLTAWDQYKDQRFLPEIVIGNNVNIGAFNHITAINKIVIGDGCLTGKWVTITDNSHGDAHSKDCFEKMPSERELTSKGEVIIKNNVWIGDKATILPGVTVGENCVIGANSVVTNDVPPFSVVVGNPAKVIRTCK